MSYTTAPSSRNAQLSQVDLVYKYFSCYALGGHYIRKGRKWRAAGRHKGSESGLSIILVSMIDAIILVFDRSFPLVR